MGNKVAEVLAGALDLLGPTGEHWTQGVLHDGAGSYCLVGAVEHVVAKKTWFFRKWLAKRTLKAIAKELPPYYGLANGVARSAVIRYNDHYLRGNFPQARAVLCSALKKELGENG